MSEDRNPSLRVPPVIYRLVTGIFFRRLSSRATVAFGLISCFLPLRFFRRGAEPCPIVELTTMRPPALPSTDESLLPREDCIGVLLSQGLLCMILEVLSVPNVSRLLASSEALSRQKKVS